MPETYTGEITTTTAYGGILATINGAGERDLARAVADAAGKYDESILMCDSVPDEAVEFLLALFANERVLHSRGIEHFLIEINVDRCKYSEPQLLRILAILLANAKRVNDRLGRHSVGDFIARAYPPEVAFEALLSLSKGTKEEKEIALSGLDVMRMRQRKNCNGSINENVSKEWAALAGMGDAR